MPKFFSFFCLLLLSSFLFGQAWAPPGATWRYSYNDLAGNTGYVQIQREKDTLIQGQPSQILSKTRHTYSYLTQNWVTSPLPPEFTYESGGVVFLWFQGGWDTLYHFGAGVGASWPMAKLPLTGACDTNSRLYVVATGSQVIHGQSRTYQVVDFQYGNGWSPYPRDTIIQGIGFIGSYLFPYEPCNAALDAVEGGPFRCYSDSLFPTYQPHFQFPCDFIVGEDLSLSPNQRVFPNPTSGWVHIPEFGGEWEVRDVLGNRMGVLLSPTEVDLSDLPPGMYFLWSVDQGWVEKILKY